jgi:hypothetical protein
LTKASGSVRSESGRRARIQSADVRADPSGRVPLRQQSAAADNHAVSRMASRAASSSFRSAKSTTTTCITAKPRTELRRLMPCSRSTG